MPEGLPAGTRSPHPGPPAPLALSGLDCSRDCGGGLERPDPATCGASSSSRRIPASRRNEARGTASRNWHYGAAEAGVTCADKRCCSRRCAALVSMRAGQGRGAREDRSQWARNCERLGQVDRALPSLAPGETSTLTKGDKSWRLCFLVPCRISFRDCLLPRHSLAVFDKYLFS